MTAHTRRSFPCALAATLALVAGRPLLAQLPDWSSIPSKPGATISLEQSWCLQSDGKTFQAFSAINRQWSTLQTQYSGATFVLNEAFLVQDGFVFHGYSPRAGKFVAQHTWTPGAALVPRPTPQTWLAVVTDGDMVHVFQAIEGTWTTFVLAGPPKVTMGTKCAVIEDGQDVYAVSAFYGTPVRLPASGATAGVWGAFGNCAIVTSGSTAWGFSAYRNTWAATPVGTINVVRAGHQQAAFAVIEEAAKVTFFSGHTGTFTSVAVQGTSVVELERAVGVVVDSPFVTGYSALLGTTSRIVAVTPTVARQQFFALVDDGTSVHAFSATTGTFAPPITASLADVQTRAETALHQPASAPAPLAVYSQFSNQWLPVPSLGSTPSVHHTAASVVLVEPNGSLHGWSMRGKNWITQATPPIDNVFVGTSRPLLEMTVVAKSGLDLWAFNSRTEAWRHTRTSAPATTFAGNNTALILHDGANAYGFSSWSDRWSSIPLAGTPNAVSAQVQAAYVDDGTHLHAYSGFGQLSTSHDYPEYWRAATLGARTHVHLAGEGGALSALLIGVAPAQLSVPGIGTLLVDPQFAFVLATPVLPQDGIFAMPMQIPRLPGISGLDLHFQALVIGAVPYLTNAVAVRVL